MAMSLKCLFPVRFGLFMKGNCSKNNHPCQERRNGYDVARSDVNPFLEFKSFIQFNVDLLTQNDVIDSILRIAREDEASGESKLAYYKWRTFKINRTLTALINEATEIGEEGWVNLFMGIQQICLFWFSVRSKDLRLIRSCDMFMFLISRVLINRIKPS